MENKYWDKLSKLQPYSFWLVVNGVSRVPDSAGNWLERHKVQELIEQADAEINELRSALCAGVEHFSYYEDEGSYSVLEKSRQALNKE